MVETTSIDLLHHSKHSSSREKLIEHLFIGELLKEAWYSKGEYSFEISKPEVDNNGYDLIIEKGSLIRHVQLKTRKAGGKANSWKVHISLSEKRAGCVIVINFSESLELGPYLFCGGNCNERFTLSEKIAKHSKGNKDGIKNQRENIRVMGVKAFKKVETLDALLVLMFGVD